MLENETSLLTSKHVVIRPDMDWSMLTQSMQCSSEYLECNANLYNYLLRFPSNYLSRNSRDDLISKALNADVFIRIGGSKAFSSSYRPNIGVPFRAFLSKCWNEYPSRTLEEIVNYYHFICIRHGDSEFPGIRSFVDRLCFWKGVFRGKSFFVGKFKGNSDSLVEVRPAQLIFEPRLIVLDPH